MNCLFCKIVAKEIPCHKVWEDENALAFLDIHPCCKGHTVVVPKKHFANFLEMNLEDSAMMGTSLRAVSGHLQDKLKPDAMNIGINNGEAAGQSVGHMHWHILPRWEGDGGRGIMHSIISKGEGVDVKEVAKLFL